MIKISPHWMPHWMPHWYLILCCSFLNYVKIVSVYNVPNEAPMRDSARDFFYQRRLGLAQDFQYNYKFILDPLGDLEE